MGGVDDVGPHLLGDQRQAALLPGQPGRPVRDRRRRRDDPGPRHETPVPLLIGALTGDSQVGSSDTEGADETVNVTAVRTAVRGYRGRVDKNTRRHDQSGSFRVVNPSPHVTGATIGFPLVPSVRPHRASPRPRRRVTTSPRTYGTGQLR